VENVAASPISDDSDFEPDDEEDVEASAAWCWECSQKFAPGRWRLNKDSVRQIVTKTLAENPIDICPEFDGGRIKTWLCNLPEKVVFTEDGWIAIDLEENRLMDEITARSPGDCDDLFTRQDELRLHPLRRMFEQGSGFPW
jgi:hypothetical protein